MRIISGTHRGRKINPPKNLPIRPTTDRAKEALFSIIDNRYYFEDKNMLDLFCGSGNISFEFASRGVEKVTAVDSNSNCVEFIETTSKNLELNVQSIKSDGLKFAQNCTQQFNFIFADPPYSYAHYQQLKEVIINNNLVKKDGLLIIEHDKEIAFEDDNVSIKKYGTVHFSIFSF
jgi:16S rRNA (guanine(966)-N(2))-methyltransferase RsmD